MLLGEAGYSKVGMLEGGYDHSTRLLKYLYAEIYYLRLEAKEEERMSSGVIGGP